MRQGRAGPADLLVVWMDSMSDGTAAADSETIVIWNAAAGSTNQAEDVRQALQSTSGVRLLETGSREEAMRHVEKACRDGSGRVIAAGGDGTVNAVVTALVEWRRSHPSSPTLAVLPLGTGNDLARSLQMPLDPTEAIAVCLRGASRPLDVLELDCGDGRIHVAGNMITAGNTGRYLEVLTDDVKHRWGALSYLRGAVDVLEELQVYKIELTVNDERPIQVDALNLFCANGRTSGGGLTVCSDASPFDGEFDLLVIQDGTGLDLAGLTVDYLASDIRDSDLVLHRRCRRLEVRCASKIPMSADGDPAKVEHFTVTMRPGAIDVVVGA